MRHTDLIGVGKAKREANINISFAFYYLVQLAAYITPGLLHL